MIVQPTATARSALTAFGARIQKSDWRIPSRAAPHAARSRLCPAAGGSARMAIGVYVPAMRTKIDAWSIRRMRARAAADQFTRWYTALTAKSTTRLTAKAATAAADRGL